MTATARAATLDEERWRYRMKDLCEATGLPRQAIHFYIQQGLLPHWAQDRPQHGLVH